MSREEMTNEEAIEVIKQDIPCEHDTDLIEALEMALKALEQEPVIEPLERLAESEAKTAKTLERLKVSEQEPVLDKIRAEIQRIDDYRVVRGGMYVRESDVVKIIDKYRKEN